MNPSVGAIPAESPCRLDLRSENTRCWRTRAVDQRDWMPVLLVSVSEKSGPFNNGNRQRVGRVRICHIQRRRRHIFETLIQAGPEIVKGLHPLIVRRISCADHCVAHARQLAHPCRIFITKVLLWVGGRWDNGLRAEKRCVRNRVVFDAKTRLLLLQNAPSFELKVRD